MDFSLYRSGVYVFYVQLMKHYNDHITHFVIEKAGVEICENSLDDSLTYDKSSCMTTVHAKQGEEVFVRLTRGSGSIEGNVWNSFTGFLLSPDF